MSNKFINISRQSEITLPSNLTGWLDNDNLARFIVDVVEQLDTQKFEDEYCGGGSQPYPPKLMLALLFYCYIKGIFSSRQIEIATYEQVPVIFIANGLHPDHTSIAAFRKRFINKFKHVFIQILEIAVEMGILKLGDINIDGTKIHANASKHKAMSWKYANKLEAQLRKEIEMLLKKAEEASNEVVNDIDIPDEIKRRETRLEKIAEAKETIKERHAIRYEKEKQEYEEKMKAREKYEEKTGQKARGRLPAAPSDEPKDTDQVNFTDEESRIMPLSGGGFEQAYNAQATVDMDSRLIVTNHVTQNTNDKREVEPMLTELALLPESCGEVKRAALDNGYHSEENHNKLADENIESYIPSGRQKHNQWLKEYYGAAEDKKDALTVMDAAQERMKSKDGKAFYAKRKSTIEPTFGIVKNVMGFRQFMLRGLEAVGGEWTIVTIAFNLKRLCVLNLQIVK